MPHLRIETNLPRCKIPQDFVIKATSVLSHTLNKPEQYCAVSVIADLPMSFSGTTEICGVANVMSIGGLGVEKNKVHSKALFELIEKELKIPSERTYITYQNLPSSDVGYKGTTFHGIFG